MRKKVSFRIGMCPPEENILISCTSTNDGKGLAPFKYAQPMLLPKVRPKRSRPGTLKKRYNVMVLGIDALSRLNFLRQMKKTREWLEKNNKRNKIIEMFGYNKIGENSAPNQIPMMTGESYIPGMMDRAIGHYFDNISSYIWQDYSKQNFNTLFFEEQWPTGLFIHPSLRGFLEAPTDYWPRPIMQAADQMPSKRRGICFGPIYASKIYLDYLRDLLLVSRMSDPLFSYAWFSELSHDILIGARRLDEDFRAFFEELDAHKLLDETVILFLSDHGSRLEEWRGTEVGRYEDMLPFFYVMLPNELLEKRPEIENNLSVNSRRLATVYDIHATLKELTEPGHDGGKSTTTERGYSLISERIPEERTCLQAGINLQFCSCLKPTRLRTDSRLAKEFATLVLDTANKEILENNATSVCATWSLSDIYDVFQLQDPQNQFHVVKILLYAEPAKAMFEASAVYRDGKLSLNSRVERLDWYSSHAGCVENKPYARYCFCEG
ncbi:uncharacterized protein LOC100902736 [Galendromus occidentalis]|uniref:Uncharacterized protein LOC100902736 n=1 Tax=Galendromus occidentalis TaxID=34638 RepID=A0AAJ7WHK1_9ACAR|nr:uncharacterized protein LOC100902736 [Galendromus occidentalis]